MIISLCFVWSVVTFEPRFPWYRDPSALHAIGFHWRLCLLPNIQDVWWRELEAQYRIDPCPHPRYCLLHLLLPQSIRLGKRLQWRSPFYNDAGHHCYLVPSQRSSQRERKLGRVQATSNLNANEDKPNPQTDPTLRDVSQAGTLTAIDWHPTIRCHLCGALFHHDLPLDEQDILHVWLPLHLLWAYDHHLGLYDHTASLLPALC